MYIYYNPEDYGLQQIFFEDHGEAYEFNMFVVWLHKESGRIFYGQDSGCSCPTPFEDEWWNSVDDNSLNEVTRMRSSINEFESRLKEFGGNMEIVDTLKNINKGKKSEI